MSFKKSKIKNDNVGEILINKIGELRNSYISAKKKNFISGVLLSVIGILIIFFIGTFTFGKLSAFKFDLSFLNVLNMSSLSSAGPQQEKINILLTGVGGGSHEGAELTDTIILASINTKKKMVTMLSLPRDLYVSYPAGGAGRINELYFRGLKNLSPSKAMTYLEDKVSEITGEKIDYYANIDFDGFIKFVDLIDGIKVDVPEKLVDTEYPDSNWGYETFSIKKGLQKLNGTTALKYARSRHSTSDFDRSLRQQLVIKAIKDKLFKLEYIGNPVKLKSLFYAISSNIKTDLSLTDMISFALLAKSIPTENIYSFNLNTSCFDNINLCERGGFLYYGDRSAFGGASVVLPEGATASNLSRYGDINKFSNMIFNYPEVFKDKYEINIVNTTKVSGLANRFATELKKYGFNIPEKDSILSTKDKFEKTKINFLYDEVNKTGVSPDNKSLEAISQFIFSEQIPSKKLTYSKNPGTKIEIVIGNDYKLYFK
ncbi:MAG: LCP family protein [Candidatus Gracilibacteria bacterium]|nr:LCP family protein [Candidatus Gracilibacteria bacterium]